MKRNRLLIFAVLLMIIASGVNAQYVIQKSELPQQQSRIKRQVYTPIEQNRQKSILKSNEYFFSRGYNEVVAWYRNLETPNSVLIYAENLINDTTMKFAEWDTEKSQIEYTKPFFMAAATIFDPNTEYFTEYYGFDRDYRTINNAYTVDSLFIKGNYKRAHETYTNLNSEVVPVVDTLIIEMAYGDTSNVFTHLFTTTEPKSHYSVPVWTKNLNAANGIGKMEGLGYKVVKHPLTTADQTLDENNQYLPLGIKYYAIPVGNFNVPENDGGNQLAITYTFKSGIPRSLLPVEPIYSSTEDAENNGQVYQDINSFKAAFFMHKDGEDIFYDPTSFAMNYAILKRHVAQNWSGDIYNRLLYNLDYLGWDIIPNVKGDFGVGIREVENAKVMNAYPNPVKRGNVAVVNLELANASNVSYGLYDITGKLISSENFGKISNGNKSFEINTSDLKSGIYFYTVTVEGNKINNKLMVIE